MTDSDPTSIELTGDSAATLVQVYRCRMSWEDLQETDHQDVRYCDNCWQTVNRVVDVEGFRRAVAQSRCVMAQGRNPGDGKPVFVVGMAAAKPYELDSSKLTWEE